MTNRRTTSPMFHQTYEDIIRFASEGELAPEVQRAKAEWVQRTGELFESDASFERRISAFLEWYALDRPLTPGGQRPIDLYLAARATTPEESERLAPFTRTFLSIFEFRKAKGEVLLLTDLIGGTRLEIYERRRPAGLDSGDLLEARVLPYDGQLMWSESVIALPSECRRQIAKVLKRYRKLPERPFSPLELVHRVDFFNNRCERYKHVAPKKIFADLENAVFGGGPGVTPTVSAA